VDGKVRGADGEGSGVSNFSFARRPDALTRLIDSADRREQSKFSIGKIEI
jgi:hypothetical protein